MNPKTFLVDFVPNITKVSPAQSRRKEYVDNLLMAYDLGEIIPCSFSECKARSIHEKPDVVICTNEYEAREIKDLAPESAIYVAESVNSIFSRKSETEDKMEKNRKIFEEAAYMVNRLRESSDEERQQIKKFHSMSYDELYKMIQKAIISEDENLRKQAWDLLWGPGEKHSNIIWMRVQLMAEVWEHAKGKTLEELMLMSMSQHVDQGTARKLDNFVDDAGHEYHQYMFLDPFGKDTNHIRRLPFAVKGQERFAYENLLEKNEVPANYLRVQLEANTLRKQWDDHIENECNKVHAVLDKWSKDKSRGKKELGVGTWHDGDDPDGPLTEQEAEWLQNFIGKYSKTGHKN